MFISLWKQKIKLMRRKRYHVEKFQLSMKNMQEPPGKIRRARDVGCQCDPSPIELQFQRSHSKAENGPLLKTLFEYSQYTSVHGIKYLTQSRFHWIERFFWILSIVISLIICAVFISFIYQQWQKTPVRLSFSEKTTTVTEIPFPVTTICPETKARKNLFDIMGVFRDVQRGNASEENYAKYQIIQFLCNEIFHGIKSKNITTNQAIRNSKEINIVEFLDEIAPSLDDVFHTCHWQNVEVDCSKYFSKVITDQGVCYTFNLLDRREIYNDGIIGSLGYSNTRRKSTWTIEDGYTMGSDDTDPYPEHVLGSGMNNGMSLVLKLNTSNYDYLCNDGIQGFRLHLNNPTDVPRLSTSFINISPGHFAVIGLIPEKTTVAGKLISYSPDKRRCFYSLERKLKYFKQYTQQNCQDECLTDFTIKSCGCVLFWMPRLNETRICNSNKDLNCTLEAELNFSAVESKGYLNSDDQHDVPNLKFCECFPACYSIEYDHQISTVNFDWIKMHSELGKDVSSIELARLKIFFKDQQFITIKHNEVYSFSDLVAAIGGLLGLFLGASMLSVVEIIYFFFVHIFMNFVRKQEPISN